MATRKRTRRARLTLLLCGIMTTALVVQLLRVTLLASSSYTNLAVQEAETTVTLPGLRGSIVARNGEVLAMSELRDTIIADPLLIKDPAPEAATLAKLLALPATQVESALTVKGGYSVVAQLVHQSVGSRIESMALDGELPGINVTPGQARYYPAGSMAEPVIGRVGADDNGLFGLEYQYQNQLAGKNGYEVERTAAGSLPLPDAVVKRVAPVQGKSLELTIDPDLQEYAEQAVAGEIEKTNAIGGTAVVMDVATGQILAMVSLTAPPLPGAHPLANGAQPVDVTRALPTQSWINQAVAYAYEPGSVAKIATFTAALQDHLITPTSTEVVPGQLDIDGSIFHDAEPHPTEVLSMRQILAQSSNIGTIEIARRLGPARLLASFERFGWGEPTGLAFPGETQGYLKPVSQWSPTAIGSTPIGQDQLVTPLQVLDSYNAIANGGVMVTPKLVLGTVSADGHVVPLQSPAPRRIVPKTVDEEMIQLLSGVTGANATAPDASIPGYLVAGKTGTSQKPLHTQAGYQMGAYWGTFVGMVPAQHPVLSAIVMLDQPVPIYGGMTAAPVFSQIMRYALARYGVSPTGAVESTLLPAIAGSSASRSRE
ncbi:penicillin-binding protein 2 [Ferrimicrobium sp.]|uniref:peptidoglycan D,D-transpeptidase FtsI family protein n=1 Tax=Ferrimicrobium sp. TaxID=2926050 RepID=UPI002610110C|nr:penicillin-binding protein 2 [Ferrimicrobium sp.]